MTARRRPPRPESFGTGHNRLFGPGVEWDLNACVGWNGGPADFERYARGYIEAAQRLVVSLRVDSRAVDSVIYPLALLYRHGIESILKHLAQVLPFVCDEQNKPKLDHKFLANWRVVRQCLDQLGVEQETLIQIETRLNELDQIDRNGEVFRYPTSKSGEMYLQNLSLINIDVLAAGMDELWGYLNAMCYWASDLYDSRCEDIRALQEAEAEMAEYHGMHNEDWE